VTFQEIRYEVAEATALITLHRPDRLNAVTPRMLAELLEALERADQDDEVRAVIVTGAGRAFCAGADLGSGPATFDYRAAQQPPEAHRDPGGRVTLRIFDLTKPVIAAINGPAAGFGVTLTLPMDVRLAATSARLGFVFVRRGIVPESCSAWCLPRLVGMARAAEWVLTGRLLTAQEALEGGLVNRVLEPEALLPAARALAREIAQHTAPVAVALARQMLWKTLGTEHPLQTHRLDSLAMYWTGQSADAREGVQAFLERRPPRFTLRPSRDLPPFYPWWTPAGERPGRAGRSEPVLPPQDLDQ
jgi:enoyl-CoA hydratase/carnithine racemase